MSEKLEIENALIESTYFGGEDHGIMTAYLYLKYDMGGQGFGGYGLDMYNEKTKEREGTAYGLEFVRRVLETVGVKRWEDLPGKYIRVEHTWTKVSKIGHIIQNKWFEPEKDLKRFIPKEVPNAHDNS